MHDSCLTTNNSAGLAWPFDGCAQEVRLEQQLAALDDEVLLGDPVGDGAAAAAAAGGHDDRQLGAMLSDEADDLGELDPEELAELEGELQVSACITTGWYCYTAPQSQLTATCLWANTGKRLTFPEAHSPCKGEQPT